MSATSTPESEPAAPPPLPLGHGDGDRTPIVPASVDDMFDLAAPPLEAPVIARMVPVSRGASLTAVPLHQDQGTITLGRSKDITPPFRIDNVPKLSGRHCELSLDPLTLRVTLRDVSANGTFVNGERVRKGEPVVLRAGDTVSLTKPPAPSTAAKTAADEAEHVEFIFQRLKEETDVKAMVDELTCGICLHIYHRPVSLLPCMHVFCASCTSQWLREGRTTCAECRQPIHEVRPTHKIQSCVEQFLLAEPSKRRTPEDIRQLDAVDDIPPAGKSLRKRGRDSDHGSDDDDGRFRQGSGASSVDGDRDDELAVPARMLAAGTHYRALAGGFHAAHPQSRCPQCDRPSTLPDRFQCVPGGPHVVCQGCRRLFPERPLCGRPQRCHLCSAPYCGRYFAAEAALTADGQPSQMPTGCPAEALTPDGRLLSAVKEFVFRAIPPRAFGGNTTEIAILTTHLATHGILAESVWATCLERLADGTWKPDLPSVNGPLTTDSPVCARCAARVFAALLFHYRRAIPADDLPEAVTRRSNCWYGVECRTQFHKPQHAQHFNHVCYQEKRKE